MRVDLDEHGLVGRDAIDVGAGTCSRRSERGASETRSSFSTLARISGSASRCSCESLACPLVPATGIRGVTVRRLVAIEAAKRCEAVELLLHPRAPPLRLVGDHLQWRRATASLLDCNNRGDERVVVQLRGLRSIRREGD